MRDLPGPAGPPLLGHRVAMARSGPNVALARWCDRYGPTYRVRLPAPAVVTADPLLVDAILQQRPDAFRRSPRVSGVLRELGIDGVFTAEGDEWRRLRRIATRSLDAAHVRTSFDAVTRPAERLVTRWRTFAATGERIDVLDELMRYTLDVTVGLTLGHDLNAVEGRGDGLATRLPELFPEIGRRLYAPLPTWRYLPSRRRRRIEAALRELDGIVAGRYRAAQRRTASGAAPETFLEALTVAAGDEPAPTPREVLGNVLTMLLAGEDTTSATAAWTLHHLAAHPDLLERVRSEAGAAFGDRALPAAPADLRDLELTTAAVQEAIRLGPAAPYLVMQAIDDIVLEGQRGPLLIAAGTIVFVLLTRGGRQDTGRFPQPGEFRPERWLGAGRTPTGSGAPFQPFGGGPRFCPGRNLALMEATLITALLCRELDLEVDTGAGPVGERAAFSVFPTNLYLRARPAGTARRSARSAPAGP